MGHFSCTTALTFTGKQGSLCKKLTSSAMASGTEMFKQAVPYTFTIDGTINGLSLSIEGKGVGDSTKGTLKGRYTCTSGKCPMSWKALAPLLGYGLKVYVNYPVGMTQFFQETMPSGYREDRVFRYEDGGVVKSHREITLQNGMIVSKGTFVAENFPEDSPIHTQNLKSPVPPQEVITPYKDGVRSMCNFITTLTRASTCHTDSNRYSPQPLVNITDVL